MYAEWVNASFNMTQTNLYNSDMYKIWDHKFSREVNFCTSLKERY